MNEGGLNNGPGPMMVYGGPDQAPMDRPMDEERVGYELREGPAPQEAERLVGDTYSTRTVVIEPMHRGYVVKLDCHRFAFETYERVLECVGEYLKDPSGTEKKWWKKELFK